jgi:hypothetical protein
MDAPSDFKIRQLLHAAIPDNALAPRIVFQENPLTHFEMVLTPRLLQQAETLVKQCFWKNLTRLTHS